MQNLYDRMERMYHFGPKFVDITWGAGGRVAELTSEMVAQAQTYFGLETCMHLTCTDMGEAKVDDALRRAYKAGCTNILALRGDPPRDKEAWEAVDGGFRYAKDLVAHIRRTYGDHFDIGVAGYPEGCDDNQDEDLLLDHLREKVDMGASFIVTQMFYDVDNFLRWVGRVRDRGIAVPIVPGVMPIATYASFLRRANHMALPRARQLDGRAGAGQERRRGRARARQDARGRHVPPHPGRRHPPPALLHHEPGPGHAHGAGRARLDAVAPPAR